MLTTALRFLPLLAPLTRIAQAATDEDLLALAAALVGQPAAGSVVTILRENAAEGALAVASALAKDPHVSMAVKQWSEQQQQGDATAVFCRCPTCGCSFETSFS